MSTHIGITKEVREDASFDNIMKRMFPILDDLEHNAISIKPTNYIWGKGEGRDIHKGFEISYSEDHIEYDAFKIGALVYAINKEFKGAKAVLTIDGDSMPIWYGAENALKVLG